MKSEADAVGKTDHDFFSKPWADAYRDDDLMVMATGKPLINRIEASPEIFKSLRLVATSKIPLRDLTPLSPHLRSLQRRPQAPHAKSNFLAISRLL